MLEHMNPDHQLIAAQFVEREAIYNVSYLISSLAAIGMDEQDDLLSILGSDDYESAAYDEGWRISINDYINGFNAYNNETADLISIQADTEDEAWRELCDDQRIEPYQCEAYEHWIVSEYLADLLEARGEMVSRDIHGLTVWGRCTTGQAISMDGVIWEILNSLSADHWVHKAAA